MSEQPALQFGEVVDITITGAIVSGPIGGNVLYGVGDDTVSLAIGNEQVVITRSAPADGEPQPGDIWKGQDGTVYAALIYRFPNGRMRVDLHPVNADSAALPWADVHKGQHGPIRLLYRLTDDGGAA